MLRKLPILLVFVSAACGNKQPYVPPPIADAGPHPDANKDIDASPPDAMPDARSFPDARMDTGGPDHVMITAPGATDTVLTGSLDVTCHADPNSSSMDPVASVTIVVTDGSGKSVQANATPTSNRNWDAAVDVSTLGNGQLQIVCTAKATDGLANSDTIHPFLDLGPRVTVTSPSATVSVHGQVPIDFLVQPSPVMQPDPGSVVTSVTATISGVTMPLANDGMGHYTASINTDDATLFTTPLVGLERFEVDATDMRGATRQVLVIFNVDDTPPTIAITKPAAGDMVGGLLTVTAVVTDESGVDPRSVEAVIGNGPNDLAEFALTTGDGQTFTGTYDLRQLRTIVETQFPGLELVFPTISVRAKDVPGNQGSAGKTVILDYTPPVASLDPPDVREAQIDPTSGLLECTYAFDPLGLDAVDDGQTIKQISEIRARVVDYGNSAPSTNDVLFYKAGVNESTVQLYVLSRIDTSSSVGDALVVDTDGDGVCDDVNPMLKPTSVPMTSTDALELDLSVVPAGGSSFMANDGLNQYDQWSDGNQPCNPPSSDSTTVPPPLCVESSGLQRVIHTPLSGDNEIFTIPPLLSGACLGLPFDTSTNNIPDGWACVAVRVEDKLGNVSVSAPMRVCVNHDGSYGGCPPFTQYSNDGGPDVPYGSKTPITSTPPFDCEGVYNRATSSTPASTDATKTCTPLKFAPGEAIRIDL